jgi:autotransporter-associated beta strand protein
VALSFGEKPIPIKPIPKPIMKPRNQTLRPWLLALSKAIGETGGAKNPTKDGVGILQLNTANTFTGKTTVNGGAPGQADNRLGTAPGSVVADQICHIVE